MHKQRRHPRIGRKNGKLPQARTPVSIVRLHDRQAEDLDASVYSAHTLASKAENDPSRNSRIKVRLAEKACVYGLHLPAKRDTANQVIVDAASQFVGK